MTKKIVIIVLVVLIVFGLGFGVYSLVNKNSSSKEEEQEISITVKTPVLQMASCKDENLNDSYTFVKEVAKIFEEQYKKAKVKVNVVQFEKSEEDDQIIGCYNTPQATDVLYEEYMNMSTYVHTGKVVPLDDIITDEIRTDIDESYWENSTLNGKVYMMPYLGMQNTLCYNKEMFRTAGLEKYISDEDIIQSWSLEDWDKILNALYKKLPENVYPMMMYAKNEMGDTHIMTILRSRGCEFFDDEGKIKLTTPEGIEAVQWLMDCNKKSYFPKNAENVEINDCYELFMNGQLAIYINNAVLNATIKKSDIDYGYVNFPSVEGNGFCSTFLTGFEVFDNDDEKKLEVAKDFVKFIYENEDCLDYSAGALPCSHKVAVKYAEELKEIQKYIDNIKNGWNFTGNAPAWRNVRAVFHNDIKELLYGEKTAEKVAKLIEDDCNKEIEEGYASSKLHE